jgi:YegS/Rv2252/BmrU family lipid kinase
MHVFAIVNPVSGAGANANAAAQRVARVTERARHAADLAREALAAGVHTVIAWGGDGTINEVGTVLAGTNAALGIIPAGSGNGFANALGLSRRPRAALEAALHGVERLVDVGELNDRVFLNIAGIGIDARIAERFNQCEQGKRGMTPYVRIGLAEAFRFRGIDLEVELDGDGIARRALLVAFANGCEYGSGIRIAPAALVDDGRLEAIVVDDRPPLARLWASRQLLLRRPERAAGVLLRSIQRAEVRAHGPIPFHVDGEVGIADRIVKVRIRPGYLRVRVPAVGGVYR